MRNKQNNLPKIKPKFAFVVEGECEFWYLQMLKRNEKRISVDIKPEIPQKKKLKDLFHRAIELSKDYDEVFWIVDFDVIIFESRNAKKGAITKLQEFRKYYNTIYSKFKNVTIIINNPCFEFWFLLHFETTAKYFNTCQGANNQLKKYLKDYQKTQTYFTSQDNDIYLKLKPNLNFAKTNAGKLNDFDFENPNTASAQMNLFFENKIINI